MSGVDLARVHLPSQYLIKSFLQIWLKNIDYVSNISEIHLLDNLPLKQLDVLRPENAQEIKHGRTQEGNV